MIVKTVKISEKGQIAIPLEMREAADLRQGDELIIIEEGGKILLEKPKKIAMQVKESFGDLLKNSEKVAKKVWSTKADDIWDTI
jgi:AbrB family looped-hinge helix DNA binding protein